MTMNDATHKLKQHAIYVRLLLVGMTLVHAEGDDDDGGGEEGGARSGWWILLGVCHSFVCAATV